MSHQSPHSEHTSRYCPGDDTNPRKRLKRSRDSSGTSDGQNVRNVALVLCALGQFLPLTAKILAGLVTGSDPKTSFDAASLPSEIRLESPAGALVGRVAIREGVLLQHLCETVPGGKFFIGSVDGDPLLTDAGVQKFVARAQAGELPSELVVLRPRVCGRIDLDSDGIQGKGAWLLPSGEVIASRGGEHPTSNRMCCGFAGEVPEDGSVADLPLVMSPLNFIFSRPKRMGCIPSRNLYFMVFYDRVVFFFKGSADIANELCVSSYIIMRSMRVDRLGRYISFGNFVIEFAVPPPADPSNVKRVHAATLTHHHKTPQILNAAGLNVSWDRQHRDISVNGRKLPRCQDLPPDFELVWFLDGDTVVYASPADHNPHHPPSSIALVHVSATKAEMFNLGENPNGTVTLRVRDVTRTYMDFDGTYFAIQEPFRTHVYHVQTGRRAFFMEHDGPAPYDEDGFVGRVQVCNGLLLTESREEVAVHRLPSVSEL